MVFVLLDGRIVDSAQNGNYYLMDRTREGIAVKSPQKIWLTTCIACLMLITLCFGCTEARHSTQRTSAYSYDYFPVESVYWDAHRRLWFYPWNGKWESAANLPAGIRIDTRNYVVVNMDTPTPYNYHEQVAKRFPPGDYRDRRDAANVVATIGPTTGKP